jgi:hypothetical protein
MAHHVSTHDPSSSSFFHFLFLSVVMISFVYGSVALFATSSFDISCLQLILNILLHIQTSNPISLLVLMSLFLLHTVLYSAPHCTVDDPSLQFYVHFTWELFILLHKGILSDAAKLLVSVVYHLVVPRHAFPNRGCVPVSWNLQSCLAFHHGWLADDSGPVLVH